MERRTFLRGGAGAASAVAVVGAGVLGAGAGVAGAKLRSEPPRDPEATHYAGMGTGAAELVWTFDTARRAVALTFDDGPHPTLTPAVADLLAEHDARATFFLIGSMAEQHPELVRRLVADGHEIGNHTATHLSLAHATSEQARTEVLEGAAAIERVAGTAPAWFRPPRGMVNGTVLRAAADLGQHVAMWSAMPRPSWLDDPAGAADRLAEALAPGAIVLFHDGTSGREDEELHDRRTRELPVLEGLLGRIAAEGYELLTLSELAASRSSR